ncbi:SDR family oxidoreductase [Draconibacterium sp.]|nr:SDR family oxidoreductase [Draconibacterium sp.]
MTSNKVAIITGASKGIGKAVSIGLAQMDYQTILIGRNKSDLNAVAQQIIDSGYISPKIILLDITDSISVKNTINKVMDEFGRIDILINNAGVYFDGSVNISETEFSKMLETNLTAQFVFLREVVPVMKEQKSGSIFNVASRAGKIGFAGSGGYSASKFGLVGLSESLYRELSPLGISVTALCPGWVNTKMAYEAGTSLEGEQMIQPEDIFKTVKWLLSLSPGACVKEVVLETPFSIS